MKFKRKIIPKEIKTKKTKKVGIVSQKTEKKAVTLLKWLKEMKKIRAKINIQERQYKKASHHERKNILRKFLSTSEVNKIELELIKSIKEEIKHRQTIGLEISKEFFDRRLENLDKFVNSESLLAVTLLYLYKKSINRFKQQLFK